jgi:hypothetical protein
MMLIVPVPWAKRAWALPFLTVLAPSKAFNEASGKSHKTTAILIMEIVLILQANMGCLHDG